MNDGKFYIVSIVIGLVIIGCLLFVLQKQNKDWKAYANEHCKVIGKVEGSVSPAVGFGITNQGTYGTIVGTTIESDKTQYLCDNGVTYWK